jgi:carbamoyl-phosphate synthase large subunit
LVSVLITGMGSTTAISVAKGIRQQQEIPVRIVGADINQRREIAGPRFCDAFYTVPKAIEAEYLPEILRVCEAEMIRVLFPIIDIELEVIAAHIAAFRDRGIHVWVSDAETVLTCNDKYKTYCFFSDHGFNTPRTWLPEEFPLSAAGDLLPLVVKPRRGVSSMHVFMARERGELESYLHRVQDPIIQEYLDGREYTIDVVTDEDARLLAVVPRERIEVKAGISYKGRTVRDERLIQEGGRIAEALKIKGPCNIQCRVKDGAPIFFEVNPRFSGALPLTIAAGVNGPLLLLKLSLGLALDRKRYDFRENVYMARYWEECFYAN